MAQAPLLILLHGIRASGRDMDWLAGALSQHLAAQVAAPDAPFAFDAGPEGRQWFSHDGITPQTRPVRVAEARPAFDALLARLIGGRDLSRVALVGYSQGAVMVLDAVASGRWPVGAAVAMSGRLACEGPLSPVDAPFLLMHGRADGTVPPQESVAAAQRLRAAGARVRLRLWPGLGHMISADEARAAGRFLRRALG